MNLFETTLRLKGFPIREAKKRLQEIQQLSETEHQAYVHDARQKIFDFHLRENLFYRDFIGDALFEKWEDIPVLTKKDLQIPLKKRLSQGFTKKNSYTSNTSGSSGTPLFFAKDKFCHAMTWAVIIDRFGWFGIELDTSFQARFYGIPLNVKDYQKERLKDRLSNRYRFPIFDLSEEKLEEFLSIFRRKKFDYINGHTSSIVLFAKYLQKRSIILSEVCRTLKYCITTSEMLFPTDKFLLENQLGVPVANEYGASELDLIAFTNEKGAFQINTETLFVELLDDNDQSVPFDTAGRVVVTSLFNKAHPFIRYEVGDIGVMDEASTVKEPILKQLIGRSNDNAILKDGKTVPGHTFYYVTKSIVEEDGNVKEFIVEQTALDAFTIVYVSERELTEKEVKKANQSLTQYVDGDLNITYKRVEVLHRNQSGKLKQFVSKIDLIQEN
ncbi:phenylacetate--CoA ligase family protein [Marixanthomonas spongiae]|uniref:AMP-binding protein n=1 Tax=Marixanthomonas spongiae TaxID=2174845 RepID=A0A2U0I229_9FLAO|nr:phenylacetate--CoA ligase family protein [Marixanthomonas spongiae]PVW15124.1 AMP-binding protein [Marixanthomonas spongiae]